MKMTESCPNRLRPERCPASHGTFSTPVIKQMLESDEIPKEWQNCGLRDGGRHQHPRLVSSKTSRWVDALLRDDLICMRETDFALPG